MSHICVPKPCSVKNGHVINHQGRCAICGKFMPAPSYSQNIYGLSNRPSKKNALTKDEVLNQLRNSTCLVEYEKFGQINRNSFSLEFKYLGSYVGSGKSKQTDNDTLFLYDTDELRFRKVAVSSIISVVEL